jgi:hypothetical protein
VNEGVALRGVVARLGPHRDRCRRSLALGYEKPRRDACPSVAAGNRGEDPLLFI